MLGPFEEEVILKNSIFLRYLPLPLITNAHQKKNKEKFIEIFKSKSYEKATLIWNDQMKAQLKRAILDNVNDLHDSLTTFQFSFDMYRDIDKIPTYQNPLNEVI